MQRSPTTQKLLTPKVQDPVYVREMLNYNQDLQKNYYDRNTKSLPELDDGNTVRIKDKSSKKEWKKAVVVAPRSYIAQDESGQLYRRNRQQLVKTPEKMGLPVVSSLLDDDTLLSEDRDIDQRAKPTPLISAPAPPDYQS